MDKEFIGRSMLVTGASGEIGAAIARNLAKRGAHVALHYNTSQDSAVALSQEAVFKANGATVVGADLSNEEDVSKLFNMLSNGSGVHDVVCNAGYLQQDEIPLSDMPLEQWQRTIDQNLTATFLCLRGFLNQLSRTGIQDPAIVLVGSMSGVWGQPGHVDYAAAKAAMTGGLLPTLKDEIVQIARQGRVNLVAPGFVYTKMIDKKLADKAKMNKVLQTASLRKFATPEDVANTVTFLISGRASGHITGEVIRLAGGKEGRILFTENEIEIQ